MNDNTYTAVPLRLKPPMKIADDNEPLTMGKALSGDKYADVIAPVADKSKNVEDKQTVHIPQRPSMKPVVVTSVEAPVEKPIVATPSPQPEVETFEKKGRTSFWNWNLQVRRVSSPKPEREPLNTEALKEDNKKFALWSVGLFIAGLVVSILPLLLNAFMSALWMFVTVPLGLLIVLTSSIVSGVGLLSNLWKRFKHRRL